MNFKIIINDDDPVILFLHKRLVIDNGWDSSPVLLSDGFETLDYLRSNANSGVQFVLLMDINMPGMTGWEVLDQIASGYIDDIHVIIISSSVNSDDHQRASRYDKVIAYLEKPVKAENLREVIKASPLSDCLTNKVRSEKPL
jgi:CheY-like chemotaxis protein